MPFKDLPPYIQHLLQPDAYPHAVSDVRLIQTHISFVLLAGEFVYKFKKPVDFGFLDFTSLAKRKYFCEQELLLNCRLSPSVYLDVVTVNLASGGGLELNGPGEVVEYGVKMARLPQDGMMDNIIRDGQLTRRMISDIVAVLQPFYEEAASGPEIDRFGTSEAVGRNVLENLEQTRRFIGCEALNREEFETIERYSLQFLEEEEVFQGRIAAGRIRDCHGDLHSANICLADNVYIYDCIEFNERFRRCDVACDVAFLAMDLDYNGLVGLAEYFISAFQMASGDWGLPEVLNFYKCYRAAVRGKVGLFTAHEPEVDDETRERALEQAARYYLLAQQYATR